MKIALQMDALSKLNKASDSTLELARAVAEMGHSIFHYQPQSMRHHIAKGVTTISAIGQDLTYAPTTPDIWQAGQDRLHSLADFDVILMRQDPPFDLAYITATHILEQLPKKTRVVNDAAGVRNAPEKILNTLFPHLMTPTLITRDCKAIQEFRDEHKDIIIKPLYSNAGHGIFHLRPGDDNLPALIETLADANPEPWITQKFLPVQEVGDKRIIMFDGKVAAGFTRMPATGDMRGTLRTGAKPELFEFTKRDHEICEAIGPTLRERGLFFSGVDIIGDYLTEINVTSPTGLVTSDKLEGRTGKNRLAEQFWKKLGV